MSILFTFIAELVGCNNNEIRLVNGSSSNEGRVEVCINGEWGAVNDAGWNRIDAQVVCKQLGYQPGCELIERAMNLLRILMKILLYFRCNRLPQILLWGWKSPNFGSFP